MEEFRGRLPVHISAASVVSCFMLISNNKFCSLKKKNPNYTCSEMKKKKRHSNNLTFINFILYNSEKKKKKKKAKSTMKKIYIK